MSDVLCPHECGCRCHQPLFPSDSDGAISSPNQPMHTVACCDGKCLYPGCNKFVKTTKAHLMDCHKLSEALANKVIKNPYSAHMILVEELNRELSKK